MTTKLEMSFFEHLSELRKRLFYIVFTIIAFSSAAYYFIDPLVELLKRPANDMDFVYLTPPELFLAYLKISVVAGIAASVPVILLQVWLFVKPGLQKKELAALAFIIIFGTIFFLTGIFFSYVVILPITLDFFLKYATPDIEAMFSFGSYVGFISSIMLAFGLAFELPIVVLILARVGLVNHTMLHKASKFVFLAIFILAAMLTPPDVISQLLLTGPMFLLYELSVLLARLFEKRDKASEDDEEETSDSA